MRIEEKRSGVLKGKMDEIIEKDREMLGKKIDIEGRIIEEENIIKVEKERENGLRSNVDNGKERKVIDKKRDRDREGKERKMIVEEKMIRIVVIRCEKKKRIRERFLGVMRKLDRLKSIVREGKRNKWKKERGELNEELDKKIMLIMGKGRSLEGSEKRKEKFSKILDMKVEEWKKGFLVERKLKVERSEKWGNWEIKN